MKLVIVASVLLVGFGCASGVNQGTYKGAELPFSVADSFRVCDLEDRCATVAEICGNKPALLAFFTTYCVPFLEYVEFLNKLSSRVGGRGCVLGVSLDLQPEQMLEPFVEEFGVRFEVYVATQRVRSSGNTEIGRLGEIPQFWVLNASGRLVWRAAGLVKKSELFERFTTEIERSNLR